jgi:hypothetical protein
VHAAAPAPALVAVASLGLVLAGCPDCRLPVGLDGAPGLAAALAAHYRDCPQRRPADDVCPGCGCEADLYRRAAGWRCGDCLADTMLADLAAPAAVWPPARRPARRAPDAQVIAHRPRRPRQDQRGWPADRAVVA